MAKSTAATVDQYLNELPPDRREIVASVRQLVLEHLPAGYEETMRWGMITYEVPLERCPNTYNGQPLTYAALSANKSGYSLHLMSVYGDGEAWLRGEFEKAAKRLDLGKSCVRFRRMEDLPLRVIAEAIARTPVDEFVALHESRRQRR